MPEGCDAFMYLGEEGHPCAYLQPFALDPGAQPQMLRCRFPGDFCAGVQHSASFLDTLLSDLGWVGLELVCSPGYAIKAATVCPVCCPHLV